MGGAGAKGVRPATGVSVRVEVGAVLFREGDPSDRAYLLERGEVEVSVERDGRRHVLCRKGPGELFGEMALVDGGRRCATVTAVTACELVPITRERLLARLDQADPVLRLCLALLTNRLRWTIGHVQGPDRLAPALPAEECARAARSLRLEHELGQAFAARELELHYQPVVSLRAGRLVGLEALIRWRHPEKGLVPPAAFLPAAEASGLIRRIDTWAVAEACAALRAFEEARAAGGGKKRAPLFVAVNVSAPGIAAAGFLDHVRATVRAVGLPAGALRLELTETVLMAADPGRVLAGCRELGVGVALDDFGTGYSSLSYLHRFPIDTVKLDRSFVPAEGAGAPAVLRGVLRLLRDLGLPAVAEGIERPEQASLVASLGARYGQGFHFARPMPARAVEALLTDGQGKSRTGRRPPSGFPRPCVPAVLLPREGAAAA